MNSLLSFKDIQLQYQNGSVVTEVIKKISLDILSNEKVAIVGKSGSGKTSLLMLMAGLEKPTDGLITFEEKVITHYKESELTNFRKENIGIVFQSFYLIPSYTTLENVALSLEINFQKNALLQAEQILVKLGLQDRLHHLPSQLSGGEQQRVAIARAVINKPKLILADEPTGNLDTENSKLVMNHLIDICKKHSTTLIVVTHDKEVISQLNNVVQMKDGIFI